MKRYARKLLCMVDFGWSLKNLSTCKREICGAVIFDPQCSRVYAIGYNGPASGLDNDSCRNSEGNCGCLHAEANAIAKLHTQPRNALMYCSMLPCEMCAAMIVNTGVIRGLIFSLTYRDVRGLALLTQCEVSIIDASDLRSIVSETGATAKGTQDLLKMWKEMH